VTRIASRQLHSCTHGLPGSWRLASERRALAGYVGVVVAAAFGDIRLMAGKPQATTSRQKARVTVSNPSERSRSSSEDGHPEGSTPSLAPEQKIERSEAPLFSNFRVAETQQVACVACSSISRSRRARCWRAMPATH